MQSRFLSRTKDQIKAVLRSCGVEVTSVRDPAIVRMEQAAWADGLQVNINNGFSWPTRPLAFVLVSSNHGTFIVNRNDYGVTKEGNDFGVGFQILSSSAYDSAEVASLLSLLSNRRQAYGDGVIALDCGANCGVHTVEWSRHMSGWGKVIAVEAQEKVYYALCGNLAINNCFNAKAILALVGSQPGEMMIPVPDYSKPASFGSLEMRKGKSNEFIGQEIDYGKENCEKRQQITIDQLNLDRVDLIKIDVEGMEIDALAGAEATLKKHKPQLFIEWKKSDCDAIVAVLKGLGYNYTVIGGNILAIHEADKAASSITISNRIMRVQAPGTQTNNSSKDTVALEQAGGR
jgi:FkbM family methyltransferase